MTWRVFEDQPTLIGHRRMGKGPVAGHRGNTVESFPAAAEAGLHGVELDVQRTTDDDLMVTHDVVLPDGRYIAEMTSGQAAQQGLVRLDDLLLTWKRFPIGHAAAAVAHLDDVHRHEQALSESRSTDHSCTP